MSCHSSSNACIRITWAAVILPIYNAGTCALKDKVFYGQEPPSEESTTTGCGVNYQLLAVITEAAQWGTPSCSRPQPVTDNGVRDGKSN